MNGNSELNYLQVIKSQNSTHNRDCVVSQVNKILKPHKLSNVCKILKELAFTRN